MKQNNSNGVLSIGQAENLFERLKKFLKACEGKKSYQHSEGRLLCIINHCFKSDKDKLFFTYTIFRHENLDKKEQDEIQNYIKKYGKPPVLNSAIPGKQDWFQELIK